jgi:hypothetical protein
MPYPRPHGRTSQLPLLLTSIAALLFAAPAAAQQFTLNVEADGAFWLDKPQFERFTPGLYVAVRPGISVGRFVSLQASYALLAAPAGKSYTEPGLAHFVTGGVRFRPLAALGPRTDQLGGLFFDVNLGYVRTGPLDRFGLDAGLGYNFQPAPWVALGPVVRYGQIFQRDDDPLADPNDAQLLTIGLNVAFGPAPRAEEPFEQPECPPEKVCEDCPDCPDPPKPCPDQDRDGVCDADDRCPKQIGPPATLGCPIDPCSGAPLVVLVQFGYDSVSLPRPQDGDPQTMDPILDAVATAIAQDPTCRVCIVGHASEEGLPDYNQDLSTRRAVEVQSYLAARGLAQSRMPVRGMGETCQIVPLTSRSLNRRVEFHRLLEGESCPTTCLE